MVLHPRPADTANLQLPCGRCVGCRTAKAQEWAARCVHEARYHPESIFATLTYADDRLPEDGHLVPRHLTLFLKRLRQAMRRRRKRPVALRGQRLRFVACGEYGEQFGRPHYHAILFGVGFDDEQVVRRGEQPLFTSPTLETLWGFGHAVYGQVTAASAAYVAGYTMKNIGEPGCDQDGVTRQPPFFRCSTRPGIGAFYVSSFPDDFRGGALMSADSPGRIPRYYKKILERDNADIAEEAAYAAHTEQRQRFARDPERNQPHRVAAAEAVLKAKKALAHRPTF